MVAVYKLEFSDGKQYIGSTHDLINRLRNHKSNIKRHSYCWYKHVTDTWDKVKVSYVRVPEEDLAMTECMLIADADPDLLYNKVYVQKDNKSVTKDNKSVTNCL